MTQIDYKITLSIWWAWGWRAIVGGVILGGLGGGVVGFLLGLLGAGITVIVIMSGVTGLVIGMAVSLWAGEVALSKTHCGYELRMGTVDYKKVLSIWWSFYWRGILVILPVAFVIGVIFGIIAAFAGDGFNTVGGVLAVLASIPISLWALKTALSKPHCGDSIKLRRA